MAPYRYETTGRNRKTLVALVAVWVALIAALVFLDASIWLMGLIGLCTAPALYDLIAGRRSGVALKRRGADVVRRRAHR